MSADRYIVCRGPNYDTYVALKSEHGTLTRDEAEKKAASLNAQHAARVNRFKKKK